MHKHSIRGWWAFQAKRLLYYLNLPYLHQSYAGNEAVLTLKQFI